MQEHAEGSDADKDAHLNHDNPTSSSLNHRQDSPPQSRTQSTAAAASSGVELQDLCRQLYEKVVNGFLGSDAPDGLLKRLQQQTRTSLKVIQEALQQYSLEELAFAYNGGKDCIVVLILYLVAIHLHYSTRSSSSINNAPSAANAIPKASPSSFPRSLKSVYIQPSDPFQEVDSFVKSTAAEFHLDLFSSNLPMRDAFEVYLEKYPTVKGVFVGTRRTDPHGRELGHFTPTSHGWPDFVRIHPVIDWHYDEIWAFIRHLDIPYCSLYDKGYTSLGGKSDTHPNPSLRNAVSTGGGAPVQYRPAYELLDESKERLGRDQ